MAITEAKKRNNANYTAKCDYINVRPLKAEGAAIRAAAEASGKSLQKYILEAVRARMEQEGHEWPEHNTKAGEEGGYGGIIGRHRT